MIPIDAKIWQERDVRRDGVKIERALSDLNASGARLVTAIVDASGRNPYERRFRDYSHGLAPIDADANTIVVTSTLPGAGGRLCRRIAKPSCERTCGGDKLVVTFGRRGIRR